MGANTITDGATALKMPTFNVVQAKQPGKGTDESVVAGKAQENRSKFPDTAKAPASESTANKDSARGMSHVAVSYDAAGKVITQYIDSGNNKIYQTPSEMVLKAQEMMANTPATTATKG